ncbi:MAG TPA: hypothetical protein VMV01_15590, partial [Planctomycetota bacterium]|nr:hypothetical protein [Planctomycetota bacterium]
MRPLRAALVPGLLIVAGCATRGDLANQERRVRGLLQEQRRQVQSLQREVERLRADVEGGGRSASAHGSRDRVRELEDRLAAMEREKPMAEAPPPLDTAEATAAEGETPPPTTPPPGAVAAKPTPTPAVPPAPAEDPWRRDVAREQAEAGTV